ncbi:MAG: UDP-N-acetylmuramoyl-L-alanyl-D-glutamate--2,6-diaminopimelate ligase [Actinobacteria bacterium]|nr:UDP-N-acetylmuramoyl-L-alanyl-D-glutamate--2,6-diaminopimelate ligase [Actinomycetota bacterium]
MHLSELITGLTGASLIGGDVEIGGLAYDSRLVKPGDLFIAIRGFQMDGHDFAGEAVGRGAAAVVAEKGMSSLDVPQILVGDSRATLAALADAYYAHPTRSLKLVGVTGTNGKTTTTFLVESIFKAAGLKAGLVGTVECHIADEIVPVVRTTPEASDLQRTFNEMVSRGIEAAVIEASSHALDLHRVDGCDFDVAVFTNLSQDHLDYHSSIESYFEAKMLLFDRDGVVGVVNADDEYGRRIARKMGDRCIRYSTKDKVEVYARKRAVSATGSHFTMETHAGRIGIRLKFPGSFNVQNALAATGSAIALGIPIEDIKEGLESLEGVSGRFERVLAGHDRTIIVDYAHTPDGLEKTLTAARELTEGKLICVFGCGGDRDRAKRPLMGEVSGRLADRTIITSDNPRGEEPVAIIAEIERGTRRVPGVDYMIVEDRREAIKRAIMEAGKGDFVVIAGKGHERGQIFADRTLPFSDRQVAKEIVKELAACSK